MEGGNLEMEDDCAIEEDDLESREEAIEPSKELAMSEEARFSMEVRGSVANLQDCVWEKKRRRKEKRGEVFIGKPAREAWARLCSCRF